MPDPQTDTYRILGIDTARGVVRVSFSVDGQIQNLGGLTVSDADILARELSDYAIAYKQGRAQEQAVQSVDPEVKQSVGVDSPVLPPEATDATSSDS